MRPYTGEGPNNIYSFLKEYEKRWKEYSYRPGSARPYDSTNNRNSALSVRMAGSRSYSRFDYFFFHRVLGI